MTIPKAIRDRATDSMILEEIRFPSFDPDIKLGGVLIRAPAKNCKYMREGRSPIVVMAHGFGETIDFGLMPFATMFSESLGVHVLLFDNRSFGMSEGTPRHVFHATNQVNDWLAAIKFAKSLGFVDPARVVVWGASLAGGHVLNVSTKVDVFLTIAVVPMLSGFASFMRNFNENSAYNNMRVIPTLIMDALTSLVSKESVTYVPMTNPTKGGVPAMVATDSVYEGRKEMYMLNCNNEESLSFDQFNSMAGRSVFSLANYNPSKCVHEIKNHVLYQFAESDQLCPSENTLKVLAKVNPKYLEAIRYPGDHFMPYEWNPRGEYKQVVFDQVYFLGSKLSKEMDISRRKAFIVRPLPPLLSITRTSESDNLFSDASSAVASLTSSNPTDEKELFQSSSQFRNKARYGDEISKLLAEIESIEKEIHSKNSVRATWTVITEQGM